MIFSSFRTNFPGRLRSFSRDRRGISTIEFALIAPIAFLVLAISLEAMRLSIAYTLIDHAVFLGVHEAKLNRGVNAEKSVTDQLENWKFGVYDPKEVKLTFTSAPSMADVQNAGTAGPGTGGMAVHLRVEAELGILRDVLDENNPMKGSREMNIYYMNEPEEEGSDAAAS